MDTIDLIASAGPRNTQLLSKIAELDYAPTALKQQLSYINELETLLKQKDSSVASLNATVQKELKDHEKYRDSSMKRFAYKVGGKKDKFEERAAKEAKEYFDAVLALKTAQDERIVLVKQIDQAKAWKTDIEKAAISHKEAQEELNELYHGIFAGPTPGFPEEDAKEYPVYDAERKRNHLQTMLTRCLQAVECLSYAQTAMSTALTEMGSTLDTSTFDMFTSGGLIDVVERHYLSKCVSAVGVAIAQVEQANRLDKTIQLISIPNIAQENLVSDMIFDNPFSDIHFHHKLERSEEELKQSAAQLTEQAQCASYRVADLKKSIEGVELELKDARADLQRIRQEAFMKVARSHVPYPADTSDAVLMPSF